MPTAPQTDVARIRVDCQVGNNFHRFYAVSRPFGNRRPAVTSSADNGPGSLRELLSLAEADLGLTRTRFALPSAASSRLITLQQALPPLATPVILDGWSQPPGTDNGPPRVEIHGGALPPASGAHDLVLQNTGSQVIALSITGFPGDGIRLEGGGSHEIHGNWLGMSTRSQTPISNGTGLRINGSAGNRIGADQNDLARGNTIVGNGNGIVIQGPQSSNNRVVDNWIGTTRLSAAGLGNDIDLFFNSACDSAGHGEGRTWLGRVAATTNEQCAATYSTTLLLPGSGVLTATATDVNGNTSEFSSCMAVQQRDQLFDNRFEATQAL